ncbi:glutaredoxin family protein [Halonotius terrestris]|uniref:Glutaredoxin family protein n=1 Tax=Halonotius terrestris TaxID=2487750 RepID=A0A8J8P8T0_9EURY|nr:glutaredoxin family protein [Halonotius terrestris]TQQ79918.1 glutaredoxin family protein [Halonotius terrestris]
MAEPVEITVYSRENCHLCGVALQRIETVSEETDVPVDVTEIEIDDDPELETDYGERVPVVLIEGEEAFTYTVDTEELAARLKTAG